MKAKISKNERNVSTETRQPIKSNKKIIRPTVGNIYLIWKKKRKQNLVWRDNVCSINVCQFKVLMCV